MLGEIAHPDPGFWAWPAAGLEQLRMVTVSDNLPVSNLASFGALRAQLDVSVKDLGEGYG